MPSLETKIKKKSRKRRSKKVSAIKGRHFFRQQLTKFYRYDIIMDAAIPILATDGRCRAMNPIVDFLYSILAGLVANFLTSFFDRRK